MIVTKTIRVSKTGIKQGDPKNAFGCPVARAMTAAGLQEACAGHDVLLFNYKGEACRATTPVRVRKFMASFDNEFTIATEADPFQFNIKFKTK